jgi:hypothetical protein
VRGSDWLPLTIALYTMEAAGTSCPRLTVWTVVAFTFFLETSRCTGRRSRACFGR